MAKKKNNECEKVLKSSVTGGWEMMQLFAEVGNFMEDRHITTWGKESGCWKVHGWDEVTAKGGVGWGRGGDMTANSANGDNDITTRS
jgi:hypothetical protein